MYRLGRRFFVLASMFGLCCALVAPARAQNSYSGGTYLVGRDQFANTTAASSVTKTGTGALALGGTSTFTGTTTIYGPSIALPKGTVVTYPTTLAASLSLRSNTNRVYGPVAPSSSGGTLALGGGGTVGSATATLGSSGTTGGWAYIADMLIGIPSTSASSGVLDLAGASPAVKSIATSGSGAGTVVNSSTVVSSGLELHDGTSVLGGSIQNGVGATTTLVVRGPNTPLSLTLTGNNTSTGGVTILGTTANPGTLKVNGSIASSATVGSAGFLTSGATGTIAGKVQTTAADAQILPGGSFGLGTLTMGGLTLGGGGLVFDVGTIDASTDKISVHNNTSNATTIVNNGALFNSGFSLGTYTLLTSDTNIAYNAGLNLLFPNSTTSLRVGSSKVMFNIDGSSTITVAGNLDLNLPSHGTDTPSVSAATITASRFTPNDLTIPAASSLMTIRRSGSSLTGDSSPIVSPPPGGFSSLSRQYYNTLDLVNNDLIIRGGSLSQISEIQSALRSSVTTSSSGALLTGDYAGLTWLGSIGNGYDDDHNPFTPDIPIFTPFDDEPLVGGEILPKYTWYGDADLDLGGPAAVLPALNPTIAATMDSPWFGVNFALATDDTQPFGSAAPHVSLPEPGTLTLALLAAAAAPLLLRRRLHCR